MSTNSVNFGTLVISILILAYAGYSIFSGETVGIAGIGAHAPKVTMVDQPIYFWISISFELAFGLMLLFGALRKG